MPTFYWVALGILILVVLCFLAWAVDNPRGGIIAVGVGVLFFLSGNRIGGVVIAIIGVGLYMHAKDSEKKAKEIAATNYRRKKMWEILTECWNSKTYEFNWDIWWDREDEILYDDSDQGIRKAVHSEFENMGQRQVGYINMFLEWMKDDTLKATAISKIKAMNRNIIPSLSSMFTFPKDVPSNTSLCNMVKQYQQDLWEYIIWEKKTLTPAKLDDMIRRGEAIRNA